jgi:hypothetical protein
MIAKCANPACMVGFDHRIGGKFFRFQVTEVEVFEIPGATPSSSNLDNGGHVQESMLSIRRSRG